jgi:hypothetical protein
MLVYAWFVCVFVQLVFEVLYVELEFSMLLEVVDHSPNYPYRNSPNYGFLSVFQAGFALLSLPLSDGICRLVYAGLCLSRTCSRSTVV